MEKKTLKNLIELDSNLKLYIPSNIHGKEFDNTDSVNSALSLFSSMFGGATSYNALGCWLSPADGLVKEKVIIVESFCNDGQLKSNIESIIDFADKMKTELKQEAMALEVNNKLYFV